MPTGNEYDAVEHGQATLTNLVVGEGPAYFGADIKVGRRGDAATAISEDANKIEDGVEQTRSRDLERRTISQMVGLVTDE